MDNMSPMPAASAPMDAIPPQPALAADYVPAGFWIRAGAYMIDGLLITCAQILLYTFLLLAGAPKFLANVVGSLLGIGYFVWMPVACGGQTVGKMAAGIAIVRPDGSPLTVLRCLGRWAGYILSTLLAGLGFVMAAFTDQKRALHDYLAGTRVVRVQQIGSLRQTVVVAMAFIPSLLGAAAVVAMPRLTQQINMANEGANQASLALVRAAGAKYYADGLGKYPERLSDLQPKYLPQLPTLHLKDHAQSDAVMNYDASVCAGSNVDPAKVKDTGQWGYVADSSAPCHGVIFVDCTHTDSRQKQWLAY